VELPAIVVAVALVLVELGLRALRWQRLLEPLAAVPLLRTGQYLAIGYFANTMLPARLGDLARAFLAGRSFGVSRLGVLGTILVERLTDGLFILAVVVVLGVFVAGGESLATTAAWLVVIAAAGAAVGVAGLLYLRAGGGGRIRGRLWTIVQKVLRGAEALRSPVRLVAIVALTAAAFATAVVTFAVIAGAAGVELSPWQAALVMGGLALSTSIPAAPGSLGTYEFVGLSIMTAIGFDPEVSLAVVVLVHLVATLPVALAGLVAAWRLHFRVAEIARDAEPAAFAGDEPVAG
jgi:uncharacterized protein (TIRG00374 family)